MEPIHNNQVAKKTDVPIHPWPRGKACGPRVDGGSKSTGCHNQWHGQVHVDLNWEHIYYPIRIQDNVSWWCPKKVTVKGVQMRVKG